MTRVVAGLIARDSRLLICQRRREAAFPLKWEFPGGKVKTNETLEAALIRELAEELGVQATIGPEIYRTAYKYPERPDPVEVVFFTARIASKPISNPERAFEQMVWVLPPELPRYDFLVANADLVNMLASGAITVE
jgi:8-oxo-dGTP diphosphatase